MTPGKQSHGKCAFCGREMTGGGFVRHLDACSARQEAIEKANQGPGSKQTLYHLYIKDEWNSDFWLHLEMNGKARLEDLDQYLRAIWLECCGHLSQFGDWHEDETPMEKRADRVFEPGVELMHIYDFGTESRTLIRVVDERQGKPLTKHPIKLMARNDMPEYKCTECDEPAKWWCPECVYEHDESGLLCEEHAEDHPHDDYGGVMPLVNSPRVGMCGYDGPAEPPY